MLVKKLHYLIALIAACVGIAERPVRADGFIPPELIVIPAGPFIMGSDKEEREVAYRLDEKAYGHSTTRMNRWYEGEKDRHRVFTDTFMITKFPITNADYAPFVSRNAHPPPVVNEETWAGYNLNHPFHRTRKFSWNGPLPPKGREKHPVVLISQADAVSYATWLSKRTGMLWRLPSEAEWEKAVRGGEGQYFPWGDTYKSSRLNSHDDGPFDTMAVGSFPSGASPFGLMDGSGQVFEWTSDESENGRFIVKGGSWDDKGCGICRPAARHFRPADIKHILIGFRLVCETCSSD
jgi:toxoflavin biosynthesis protein ToxD